MRAEFFLVGMVGRGDEEGGRILLGDKRDSGAVMLQPIGLQYFRFRTTPGGPCTVYTHVYSVPPCAKCRFRPDLPERNYCEGVYLLTFGWCTDRNQASHRT